MSLECRLLKRRSYAFLVSYIPAITGRPGPWVSTTSPFGYVDTCLLESTNLFRESILRSSPLTCCNPILIVKEHRNIIPHEQLFGKNLSP